MGTSSRARTATFAEVKDGLEPLSRRRGRSARELRALLDLRDRARELLAAEAQSLQDTPRIAELRDAVTRATTTSYYAGTARSTASTLRRTGRIDAESGEERMARITPPRGHGVARRPVRPAGDEPRERSTRPPRRATPAALLLEAGVAPRAPVLGVDTAQDALAVCLDTRGHVELDEIARLLGRTGAGCARASLASWSTTTPATPG